MKKEIIICVDDEKIVLNGLKAELKNSFGDHFIIETAENATEALQTLDELLASGFSIPVIISDYAMPSVKGDELLARVHEKSPDTLKILLTGQATVEGVTNAINNADLYRYIEKPWETNDLILTVEQAIKSYNQKKQLVLQNKQLRELSSSLEEKVEERTNDLIHANQSLIEKQKEITTQNEELEKHRNHLESLVNKRTQELSIAKEKAEENDRLKSAFIANISHEVRTPMNGIIGFIDLMRSPDYDLKDQMRHLDIIEKCGHQLVEVITDIVEISRLETNQVKPVLTTCEIHSIRDNILALFHGIFDSNPKIQFLITGIDKNHRFLTDEIKLKQILTNLINNAIKNTKQGTIELGYRKEDNSKLLFFVRDSGIGIPKEFHKIIFERFRQVDTPVKRMQEGTGLGLSISKAYVELLGGNIWLESVPNKGSTFFLTIPFIPVPESIELKYKKPEVQSNGLAGITMLVAEDTDLNFVFLEIILKRLKINVLRAENGEEAVKMCRTNDLIDMVLMDIKMPLLNGYEAARKILEFRSDLPIIAQTAYANADDREKALDSGFVDHVSKPINTTKLVEVINKHLVKQAV